LDQLQKLFEHAEELYLYSKECRERNGFMIAVRKLHFLF
jgi:hypothetical protein